VFVTIRRWFTLGMGNALLLQSPRVACYVAVEDRPHSKGWTAEPRKDLNTTTRQVAALSDDHR
jgi:hypothetical protein